MSDVAALRLPGRLRPGRLRPGPLGQAEAAKAAAGMVQFGLVARSLGPAGYGRWVAVSFLVALLLPLTTWGANSTFLRAAATEGPGSDLDRRVVRLSLTSGLLAALVAGLATPHVLPFVGSATAAAVAFAEVGLLNLLGLRALLAQGAHDFVRYRNRSLYLAGVRVVAAASYALGWSRTGLAGWSAVYLVVGAAATVPCVWAAAGSRRKNSPTTVVSDDAWLFVLTTVSLRIYDDADKYVLTRVGSPVEAGLYAAAYRLAAYLLVPVRAVLARSYPTMLRLGSGDPAAVWQQACRAAGGSVVAGCAAALPLTAAAWLLPAVAGPEYSGTALLVLALGPALGLRGAHYAFADVLTVLGRQHVRAVAQVVSFSIPLCAYLLLIPRAGAWGAVAATGLGEMVTVAVMAVTGWRILNASGGATA